MIPFVYSPDYTLRLWGLERLHPFDARKFQRIRDALVREGLRRAEDFVEPEPLEREALLRVHDPGYLESLRRPSVLGRILELPFLSLLPRRVAERRVLGVFLRVAGGAVTAAHLARERGLAVNLGGGYHHAFRGFGHGFCAVNDIAIAIRDLQARGLIGRALVVDTDLHQGDGTASIFGGDPSVFTLSIHEEENFPYPKMRSALDVGLPSGVEDRDYLDALEGALAEADARFSPDFVFYVGGSDVHREDRLGRLALSDEGVAERDYRAISRFRERGVPVVAVPAGGYSPRSWELHVRSYRRLIERWD